MDRVKEDIKKRGYKRPDEDSDMEYRCEQQRGNQLWKLQKAMK